MSKKYENEFEALAFLKSRGIKLLGMLISIKSGTLGLRTIGVIDYLSRFGYYIVWI